MSTPVDAGETRGARGGCDGRPMRVNGAPQADARTRKYTEFNDGQRPVGVQLFGGDGERMGEAARKVLRLN